MFRVNGNQIAITAGDTALMAICPDETGYVPTANDRAIFTVRERPNRRALIEKTIAPEADGRFVVCFENEDTARLKPREYVWDVRLAIQANVDESGKVTDAEQIITPCPPGIVFVLAAIGELSGAANNGFGQPVNQTLRIRFEKLMQGPRGEPGQDVLDIPQSTLLHTKHSLFTALTFFCFAVLPSNIFFRVKICFCISCKCD